MSCGDNPVSCFVESSSKQQMWWCQLVSSVLDRGYINVRIFTSIYSLKLENTTSKQVGWENDAVWRRLSFLGSLPSRDWQLMWAGLCRHNRKWRHRNNLQKFITTRLILKHTGTSRLYSWKPLLWRPGCQCVKLFLCLFNGKLLRWLFGGGLAPPTVLKCSN